MFVVIKLNKNLQIQILNRKVIKVTSLCIFVKSVYTIGIRTANSVPLPGSEIIFT